MFNRTWPAVDPETRILLAVLLLRSNKVDALPLVLGENDSSRFVSGFSCLSKLVQTDPTNYKSFFEQSCESVSLGLPTIPAEKNLESLLEAFSNTGFGFAWAEWKHDSRVGGFLALRDLLPLYGKSIINTDLLVRDIASPNILSLDADTSLEQALNKMILRKVRRVLISENQKVISDREIIEYVFSPDRLEKVLENPSTLLEGKLRDLESTRPISLRDEQSVGVAAELLHVEDGGCAICESGIVTPWDVVIKPWKQNRLRIEN